MERAKQPDQASRVVVVSSGVFRLCWWLIIAFHLFNVLMAYCHVTVGSESVYPNIWMLSIDQDTLVVAGWTYAVLALLQFSIVGQHVVQSVRDRRLSFGYQTEPSRPNIQRQGARLLDRLPSPLTKTLARIDEDTAELLYQIKQFIEIQMQMYQANQFSRFVARYDIQVLVVATIVVNCLHTAVFDSYVKWRHRGLPKTNVSPLRSVVLCVFDILLDFHITVLVPVAVILPRLREFDFTIQRFPVEFTYDDVWGTVAINEGRQVLVTSLLDYISSIAPHVVGMLGLAFIKSKIRCASHQISQASHATQATSVIPTQPSEDLLSGPPATHVTVKRRQKHTKKLRFVHVATCVYAGIVVGLHIHANHTHADVDGCLVVFHAWLAKRLPCAALRFNCYAHGNLAGTANEVETVLNLIHRPVLRLIVFSHCPALEIPPSLVREFPRLNTIATFNCTIHQWGAFSALSRKHTPTLSQLQLVDTNMTAVPESLLHSELPLVINVILHRSNLSELPDNIGDYWGGVQWSTLWLESTKVSTIPESFSKLQVTKLSFEGSPVTSLPVNVFNHKSLSEVRLSKTRLTTLPEPTADSSLLKIFLADETNVTAVPTWLRDWKASHANAVVSLRGSPVCGLEPKTTDSLCQLVGVIVRNGFPYDTITAQRPLHETYGNEPDHPLPHTA